MARGFKRTRRGLHAKLDAHERALLAHLFVEVHELLDDEADAETDPLAVLVGIGTAVEPPSDPALARLLPDAHRDDAEAAAEFRRYTEAGLRQRKRDGLELARRSLGRSGDALVLQDAEAQAWVVALTDVRLVLASRLGLQTDDDHERLAALAEHTADADSDSDADAGARPEVMLAVYDFLTWLQETLVEALLESLPD